MIGYGVVTGSVLSFVNDLSDRYSYTVSYIEHEKYPFNGALKYSENNSIEHLTIQDKKELTLYLTKKAEQERLLIVSASNNYLFPKAIAENTNVKIVNFHNALLPDLPGRNAPSWAIFNGLKKTGITWHYVTAGIDEGDIIIQKECSIDSDTKAYELVAIQMKLAGDAFKECFESVISGTVVPEKQDVRGERKVYKSFEVPSNGVFSINDKPESIYKLLRALDYGKNSIFPNPSTVINGQKVYVKRYKKVNLTEKQDGDNKVYLPFADKTYLMIKYAIE